MSTQNTMPKLKFSLQALADSVISRADKGVLILILDDKNVQGMYTYKQLRRVTENWETANKNFISTAFSDYGVAEIKVVSQHVGADATVAGKDNIGNSLSDCLAMLNQVFINGWLVAPQIVDSDAVSKKIIADFVKSQRKSNDYPLKAVLYNYEADSEGIVNFTAKGLKNKVNGTLTDVIASEYILEVASYLCTLGANEGITNHVAKNITLVDIVDDADLKVSNGELFLVNNGTNIVYTRGVNSKQTFATNESEVLSKIRVVEIIDMVKSDLRETFNNSYIGKYGNSYANRKSLVSQLNGTYFKTLMKQGYLSNDEVSYCELDVNATKTYLESLGVDTDNLKDIDVLRHKIDTHVFISCKLLVMDVMEDIFFVLNYTT